MIRIVIVDNEAYVVESIQFYLESQTDLDAEIYGCYSAAEVLELMGRMRVDILISDIRMPVMDGLTLQKRVVADWPQCHTLFLTGYSEFDYIQQAMRNGACDYLLKTEGKETIIRAVRKIIATLEQEKKNQVEEIHRERMTTLLSSLRDQFFRAILREPGAAREGLETAFASLEIDLDPGKPILLLLGRPDAHTARLQWEEEVSLAEVKQLIERAMAPYYRCYGTAYRPGWLAWVLQPFREEGSARNKAGLYLNEWIESEQKKCKTLLRHTISFALSAEGMDWEGLYEKRVQLENMLYANQTDEAILVEAPAADESVMTEQRLTEEIKRVARLGTYLEVGNKYEFFQALDHAVGVVESLPPAQRSRHRLEMLSRLLSILTGQMNQWNFWEELSSRMDTAPLYGGIWAMPFSEAMAVVSRAADGLFDIKAQKNISSDMDMVQRLHYIIGQNIGGDLSLPHLGELVGMNPYYMARCYQQITGDRLTNYIANVRIEAAKKMIETGGMLHRNIAKAIGFGSEQAFNRFFKKMCGMAPQEWRETKRAES